MTLQEFLHVEIGYVVFRVVEVETEGESLRRDDIAGVVAHKRLGKGDHYAVLDILVKPAVLLVIGVDIGLDGYHFNSFSLLFDAVVDH